MFKSGSSIVYRGWDSFVVEIPSEVSMIQSHLAPIMFATDPLVHVHSTNGDSCNLTLGLFTSVFITGM